MMLVEPDVAPAVEAVVVDVEDDERVVCERTEEAKDALADARTIPGARWTF